MSYELGLCVLVCVTLGLCVLIYVTLVLRVLIYVTLGLCVLMYVTFGLYVLVCVSHFVCSCMCHTCTCVSMYASHLGFVCSYICHTWALCAHVCHIWALCAHAYIHFLKTWLKASFISSGASFKILIFLWLHGFYHGTLHCLWPQWLLRWTAIDWVAYKPQEFIFHSVGWRRFWIKKIEGEGLLVWSTLRSSCGEE